MDKIELSRRDILSIVARAMLFTIAMIALTLAIDYTHLVTLDGEFLRSNLRNDLVIPVALGFPSFLIVFWKIRQLARAREELQVLANTDSLTGVLNRRAFQAKLETLVNAGGNGECALFVIDIDNFKTVNDTFGHDVGDQIISIVVNEIINTKIGDEIVGRIGGEEFVVFQPRSNTKLASIQAEHIRISVESSVAARAVLGRPVTISLGVAALPRGTGFQTLYKVADEALYDAKNRGRNCATIRSAFPDPIQNSNRLHKSANA